MLYFTPGFVAYTCTLRKQIQTFCLGKLLPILLRSCGQGHAHVQACSRKAAHSVQERVRRKNSQLEYPRDVTRLAGGATGGNHRHTTRQPRARAATRACHASYLLLASATMCCANGSLHVQPGDTMFRACVLLPSPSILRERYTSKIKTLNPCANVTTRHGHRRQTAPHRKSITSAPLRRSISWLLF